MHRDAQQLLTVICLLCSFTCCICHSLPGRPRLIGCRSPEKETFTCWWKPGARGGLPTTHQLYYTKENSVDVLECPDYFKAGNNSCYFSKKHTSLWIQYNITVVASNALGKTYSESLEVDVMDIVQPYPPERVNVSLIAIRSSVGMLVQWLPPHGVDTHSGWVTIKYELRLKIQDSSDEDSSWESYSAGKHLEYNIYSPRPRANYFVQVRCKLDQGLWSDWSPGAFINITDNMMGAQNVAVIFAVTLTVIIFVLTAGLLTSKQKLVKHFLLPPVPEPKIIGLDTRLLKSGKPEEIFSALVTPGYPQVSQRTDRPVEFLLVSDWHEEVIVDKEQQKGEIFSSDTSENVQIIEINPSMYEETHHSAISNQQTANSSFLEEPQPLRSLTYSELKPQINSPKREQVTITALRHVEYVEVSEGKHNLVGQDYSVVSDVLSDIFLVLKDSFLEKAHKEIKHDKTKGTEETMGLESSGNLESCLVES
ncbi:hypothetical protein DNTS_021411 [Danionella cerebrum]|uniref:Prolactin receptor n=1 Tax=Danionella cerebrum TaxID=2873325 RepID=A0A553R127_9TELE|nr:hypothetical protein DNTS_021411 [Danionella translucida]